MKMMPESRVTSGERARLAALLANSALLMDILGRNESRHAEAVQHYARTDIDRAISPESGDGVDGSRHSLGEAFGGMMRSNGPDQCLFEEASNLEALLRQQLKLDLRATIAVGGIGIAYQPILCVENGQISSVEVFARWDHPTFGPIRSAIFIGLAESLGLMDTLGDQLLTLACKQASEWPSSKRVAFNLSPLQFSSGRVVNSVKAALSRSGLVANRLQLEVNEKFFVSNLDSTLDQVNALKTIGVQLLIDDFGSDCSHSYIKHFRFDQIKFKQSIVDNIHSSTAFYAFVRAVSHRTRRLKMGIVAKGVENGRQRDLLIAAGCTHLQGDLFSRPLPFDDVMELLERERDLYPPHASG